MFCFFFSWQSLQRFGVISKSRVWLKLSTSYSVNCWSYLPLPHINIPIPSYTHTPHTPTPTHIPHKHWNLKYQWWFKGSQMPKLTRRFFTCPYHKTTHTNPQPPPPHTHTHIGILSIKNDLRAHKYQQVDSLHVPVIKLTGQKQLASFK